MLDQATAHVPIDLPVCTRGIPNGKVVRPAFQVPIQLSSDLAGSATARRLVLAKAQPYLEMLSRESSGDLPLQRELASAYEKTGDLLHDATGPGEPTSGTTTPIRC